MSDINEIQQKKAEVTATKKRVNFFNSHLIKSMIVLLATTMLVSNKIKAQQNMVPETDLSKNRLELFFNDSTTVGLNAIERAEAYKRAYMAEFMRRAYLFLRDNMLDLKSANNGRKTPNAPAVKRVCGKETADTHKYCMQFSTKLLKTVDQEMAREYGVAPMYAEICKIMTGPQSCQAVDHDLGASFKKNGLPIGKSGIEAYFAELEKQGLRGPVIGINKIKHVNKKTGKVYYTNHAVTYFAFKDENGDLQLKWISANRESENAPQHGHPYSLYTYCGFSDQQNLIYAYTKTSAMYSSVLAENSLFAQAENNRQLTVDVSPLHKPMIDASNQKLSHSLGLTTLQPTPTEVKPHPTPREAQNRPNNIRRLSNRRL